MTLTSKRLLSLFFLIGLSLVSLLPFLAQPMPAQAQASGGGTLLNAQTGFDQVGTVYGNDKVDIRVTIAKVISIVLGFLSIIFLALALFAGFKYMTSAGNEEKAREALRLLTNAVIGLIIILVSWFVTRYIVHGLVGAINNNVNPTYGY